MSFFCYYFSEFHSAQLVVAQSLRARAERGHGKVQLVDAQPGRHEDHGEVVEEESAICRRRRRRKRRRDAEGAGRVGKAPREEQEGSGGHAQGGQGGRRRRWAAATGYNG